MKHIKILAAFLAVAGLVFLSAAQLHPAKADDRNGNGATMSRGSGDNETESENGGNAFNGFASGNSGENNGGSGGEGENSQSGPSLVINPANKVVVNGATLVSNSGQSLVIKIFSLNLNAAITSSTSFLGTLAATSTAASMKTGDVIDLTGQIDANSGIIAVDRIRDETLQQQNVQNIQQQIQALLQQLKALQEQLNMKQSGG